MRYYAYLLFGIRVKNIEEIIYNKTLKSNYNLSFVKSSCVILNTKNYDFSKYWVT